MPQPIGLISFKAPVVKGADSVAVPILTAVGEWRELIATPGTLKNLGASITQHFAPKKDEAKPAGRRSS